MEGKVDVKGEKVVCVLSGGNIIKTSKAGVQDS